MKPDDSEPSVHDCIREHGEREFRGLIDVRWPPSFDRFLQKLYEVLDLVVRGLEDDADVFFSLPENTITRTVTRQLQRTGYTASAETHARGHVDILIDSANGHYRWLAEAKIHRHYAGLAQGVHQLLSRYSTGRDPEGGFLVYVRQRKADRIMRKWRSRLEKRAIERCLTVCGESRRTFYSVHDHDCGSEYRVRHMFVHLHFRPRDRR